MALVPVPVALRHEGLNPLADQLIPFVAEQTLGLGIHQHDSAVAAHANDRIRSRVQQLMQHSRGAERVRKRVRVAHPSFHPAPIRIGSGQALAIGSFIDRWTKSRK